MANIAINSKCIGCGLCTEICPAHVFTKGEDETEEGKNQIKIVPNNACIRCGHCVCSCPTEAIEHEDFPYTDLLPIDKTFQPDWESFQALVTLRRSVRRYKQEPVSPEALAKIVHVAEQAPTACNSRSVHWTVVTNSEILRQLYLETLNFIRDAVSMMDTPWSGFLAKMFPNSELGKNYCRLPLMKSLLTLGAGQDVVLFDAPALMIVHHDKKGGRFADTDAQLALQNATLAACALGLGTFYTGFLLRASDSNPKIRKLLQIPTNHRIAGGMTVGVPAVTYRYTPNREYPEVNIIR